MTLFQCFEDNKVWLPYSKRWVLTEIYLGLLLFAFTGCSTAKTFPEAAKGFAKTAWEKERLCLEGTIDGAPGKAAVLFRSDKHVGVDEARRMSLALTKRFLEYLKKTDLADFTPENIVVGIQFKERDGSLIGDNFIAEATVRKGKIHYYLFDKVRKEILVEEFEAAFGKSFGYLSPHEVRPFSRFPLE